MRTNQILICVLISRNKLINIIKENKSTSYSQVAAVLRAATSWGLFATISGSFPIF